MHILLKIIILCDFNVFFNKYVHKLVTTDDDNNNNNNNNKLLV